MGKQPRPTPHLHAVSSSAVGVSCNPSQRCYSMAKGLKRFKCHLNHFEAGSLRSEREGRVTRTDVMGFQFGVGKVGKSSG